MPPSDSARVSALDHLSRPRILIVDDEIEDARRMGAAMNGHGYDVRLARRARSALDVAAEWEPAVAILDVNLDGDEMDGVELCQGLKSMSTDLYVVFVTCDNARETHDRCLRAGDDYIIKPFEPGDLYLRVENQLDHWKRYRRASAGARSVRDRIPSQPRRKPGPLSPLNDRLFRALAAGKGAIVPRSVLIQRVWGAENAVTANALDRAITRLREQIELDPSCPSIIVTARPVGYRIDIEALRRAKQARDESEQRQ
jgi:DNA-binding response OmpR family regulator